MDSVAPEHRRAKVSVPEKSVLDALNRQVWSRDAQIFVDADTWTDRGERNAMLSIADEVRGEPILDVGVGAGRSTWLLRMLSRRYTAVDYTPEMVEICARLHPGVDVRLGDARNLVDFADESFALVTFSCNGIDAVDHDDRDRVLSEFFRVLRPGGLILFSTMDKDGTDYLRPPWLPGPHRDLAHVIRFVLAAPRNLGRYRRTYANWFGLRRRGADHGEWAIAPLPAHDYGLLVHYTTVGEQARVLARLGFEVVAMYSDRGEIIEYGRPRTASVCFHTVARKRGSARKQGVQRERSHQSD